MENNKVNRILNSMQGSQRAKPREILFEQIMQEIEHPIVRKIPVRQLRLAAAAAVFIVSLNAYTLKTFVLTQSMDNQVLVDENSGYTLISNYQMYD